MSLEFEVRGLDDLKRKFDQAPAKFKAAQKKGMEYALLALHEAVPPYPAQRPGVSYIRTGTLGKSLGVDETGAKFGQPDIYTNKPLGSMGREGRFGSNLEYAPWVIDPDRQVHWARNYWWTMKTVLEKGRRKVIAGFERVRDELVNYLNR